MFILTYLLALFDDSSLSLLKLYVKFIGLMYFGMYANIHFLVSTSLIYIIFTIMRTIDIKYFFTTIAMFFIQIIPCQRTLAAMS